MRYCECAFNARVGTVKLHATPQSNLSTKVRPFTGLLFAQCRVDVKKRDG